MDSVIFRNKKGIYYRDKNELLKLPILKEQKIDCLII